MKAPLLKDRSGPLPQAGAIIRPAFRSPRRVTITLPFATYQDLQSRADGEGRSLSNLAAFLLESSLQEEEEVTAPARSERQPQANRFN
jgi:hypothetical protein